MILILCGFLCAGKTTVGEKCAQMLSLPFIDTDRLMEGEESVSEIWLRVGEDRFREMEAEVIASVEQKSSILAIGGGTLHYAPSRKMLAALGRIFYLKVSFPVLFERIKKRGLPSFVDRESPYLYLEQLAKERCRPIYETYCDEIIETDSLTLQEVVDTICRHYGR